MPLMLATKMADSKNGVPNIGMDCHIEDGPRGGD